MSAGRWALKTGLEKDLEEIVALWAIDQKVKI